MRERFLKIAGSAFLAFLAGGISFSDNNSGSITVAVGHRTYSLNSGFRCMDTNAGLMRKSSVRVEATLLDCNTKKIFSSSTRILHAIDPNADKVAEVFWQVDRITEIAKVSR